MAFSDFFSSVRRRLGGQRGEDLSYEGWSAELQEDLRQIRDQRETCDIDLGKYGDAHSQIILAIGGEQLLNKVKNFCHVLTDEEKLKPEIHIPEDSQVNEHEEMPPMYDQATEDKINEDGRLKAENNLKDLQEKLKILEDIMGADPNGGTPEVISLLSVEEETEPIEGENDEEVPELEERADENTKETAKVDQTAQETTENAESEEKTDENADESTETPDVDRSNIPETTLSEENGEEVPPVEEKVDLDKLEMDNSIEKKEKEVLEQMQNASEPTGLDDLPPTYDECSPQTKEASFIVTPDVGDMPAVAALAAYFYTGELVVSKSNYQDIIEIGHEFNISAFLMAAEEYKKMMGPDKDEENDIMNMRYIHRDHKGAAQHLLVCLTQSIQKRKALKTDFDMAKSDLEWSIFGKFEVQRILLAATCLFFKGQILNSTVDLDLPESADEEIFGRIIDFIYTGFIGNLTQTLAREMLILCKEIEFKRLSDVLIDWLIARIRPDNCIELQLLGANHSIKQLADRARKFTLHSFKEVGKTDAFKELPCEWLMDYVQDDQIQIDFPADKGEIQLFNLLKKWADVNSEERGAQFGELVCKALRLDLMNLSDLIDVVSKDILVVASEGATSEVLKVIEYKQNNGIPAGRMRGNEAVLITGGSVPIIDEFKGGIYDGEDHHVYDASVLIFNPKTFGTHLIAQLPEKACLHQCAIVGPCLFVAGGFDSFSCIMDSVHRLDLTNGKWTKMPKMKNKRACFQLVALGDFLFAIGGLTPGGYTKTLERFDMISEEWELAAPLQESRYRHAACVTNKGKIMVSGGITSTREDGIEDVCEYNPDFDRWIARAPMHQQRDSHTMIAHGKLVFVVGGQEKERAGVEMYNIDFNIWSQLQTAPRVQYMSACGLADNKIFMIGGWEADTESLDVVSSYDFKKDEWGEEGSLGLARGSSDAAVVRVSKSYWTNKLF